MNYKIFPVIFLLVLLAFFNSSCSKGKKETTELIPFLKLNLHYENRYPLKFPEAKKLFFYRGWRDNPKPNGAISKNSTIRFFCYKKSKQKLLIKLKKAIKQKKHLSINIFLNKQYLSKINLYEEKQIRLFLPKKIIKKGYNFLTFKIINYKAKVDKYTFNHPDILYYLQKFEILDKIDFKQAAQQKKIKFIQPANSFFRVAVQTNKNKKLIFEVKPEKTIPDCKLNIRKIDKNNIVKNIKSIKFKNINPGEKIIKFNKKNKKIIVEFDYSCGNKNSYLIWEKIGLLKIHKKEKKKNSELPKLDGKPNIFLIILDAARADIVYEPLKYSPITPNISEFSKESYVFKNFYSNAPHTVPSVATILTGLHSEVHTDRESNTQLSNTLKTIPFYLNNIGYKTQILIGNLYLFTHKHYSYFSNTKIIRPIYKDLQSSFMDIKKAKEAVKSLDPSKSNFLYFHFLPPHHPYRIPGNIKKTLPDCLTKKTHLSNFDPPYLKYKKNSEQYRLIKQMFISYLKNYYYGDYLIGEIIRTIKNKNLYENSLIIITSDHGEAFGEHNKLYHGSTVYQEMIKVPFLIKFPNQKKRKIIKSHHSLIDLLPTLAKLLKIPPDKSWQGSSIFTKHKKSNYIYSRADGKDFNNTIIDYPYKYIFFSGRDELYNIKEDPFEKNNLSLKNKFKTLYLRQEIFKLLNNYMILKYNLNIKKKVKKISNKDYKKELKTLGYL